MSGGPRSVRFESGVEARFAAFLARRQEASANALLNRLVDEGIRVDEHPGVVFRDGPAGRRAVLVGGPDVREVIRAVASAREHEPDLGPDEIVALIARNTGVSGNLIEVALRYWSAYSTEIDAWMAATDRLEADMLAAWERRQGLLTG